MASAVTKATNSALNYTQSQKQTPFLSGIGTEATEGAGGTAQVVHGLFSGNDDEAKAGAKNVGKSVLSAVTGGALRSLNQGPQRQFVGGSQDALDSRYGLYGSGIGTGTDTQATGTEAAAQAATQAAGQDRGMATSMFGQGQALGDKSVDETNYQIGNMETDAATDTSGQAAALAQQQQGLIAGQMQAQAASARGGNQASAMRTAGAQASANQIQTDQQVAAMRANEQNNIVNRETQAAGQAASTYANQAQLGYGVESQGLSGAQASTGQLGSVGLGIGNLGLGTQSTYVGAQNTTDQQQLTADEQYAKGMQTAKGGILGSVGGAIGSMFGK